MKTITNIKSYAIYGILMTLLIGNSNSTAMHFIKLAYKKERLAHLSPEQQQHGWCLFQLYEYIEHNKKIHFSADTCWDILLGKKKLHAQQQLQLKSLITQWNEHRNHFKNALVDFITKNTLFHPSEQKLIRYIQTQAQHQPIEKKMRPSVIIPTAFLTGITSMFGIKHGAEKLTQLFGVTEPEKLFGYHPEIEIIPEDNQNVHSCSTHPTLFFHGWGDSKSGAHVFKRAFNVLPGTVVTFNFPDGHGNVTKTSLGQLNEVLPALYVLDRTIAKQLNATAVDLYGFSRGGAVIINMIAVLADESDQYTKALERIGINTLQRKKLLHLIQAGSIVLDCPLIDHEAALKNIAPHIPTWISKTAASLCSRYQTNALVPLDSLKKINHLNLSILLHVEYNDTIVTNVHDATTFESLSEHNTQHTYISLGNTGGHLHDYTDLQYAVHQFRKKYTGAYNESITKTRKNYLQSYHDLLPNPVNVITQFHAQGR